MVDQNKTRARKKKLEEKNKKAFTEIIGDPFRDIDGCYILLHSRSYINSIEGKMGESETTVDPAKPSISDFFCDVDNVLKSIEPKWYKRFICTYFEGELNSDVTLPKAVRRNLEQKIGRTLLARGISPIKRYFTVNPKVKK